MVILKRLLNKSEEVTDERLRNACGSFSVRIYVKARLADVIPIERSGISHAAYSFALRSHLDFLVVNELFEPLFAVEFDGPRHRINEQVARRDALKNELCREFGLPLLRVDDRFLDARYMDMDLLGWLVRVVLTRRADQELVRAGELSPEDAAASDPIFCAPFVISFKARERLSAMHDAGVCDHYPPFVIGVDEHDNAHAIAGLRLANDEWAFAVAEMPYQGFFGLAEDLLEEIIYIKLADAVEAITSRRTVANSPQKFLARVGEFLQRYRARHSFLINPRTGEIGLIG
jgi:hypothetical protein